MHIFANSAVLPAIFRCASEGSQAIISPKNFKLSWRKAHRHTRHLPVCTPPGYNNDTGVAHSYRQAGCDKQNVVRGLGIVSCTMHLLGRHQKQRSDHHSSFPSSRPTPSPQYKHSPPHTLTQTPPHSNTTTHKCTHTSQAPHHPPPHSKATMGLYDDKSRLLQVTWYTCMATSIAVRFFGHRGDGYIEV